MKILYVLDNMIYKMLIRKVDKMPKRFVRIIAYNYTDARVRKIYLEKLFVYMGEGTYSNLGLIADATEEYPVYIGNNVSIAPNATFITVSAANNGKYINKIEMVKNRFTKSGSITIEDDVWIGANVTILPGVTVGKCSVIGAGAIITKDVESYSVYAGIPAKKIYSLNDK